MIRSLIASTVAVVAALAAVGGPVASGATLRHFDATVISKSSTARTFKANVQHRGVMRFKVTRSTRFERVAGFAGLSRGLEVRVDREALRGPLGRGRDRAPRPRRGRTRRLNVFAH